MAFSEQNHTESEPLKEFDSLNANSVVDDDGGVKISNELQEISSDHEAVVEESLEIFKRVRIVGLILAFDYLIRTNVFVLYSRTFDDCPNATMIAVVVYLAYFVSGCCSLLAGFIGVKYTYG